MASIQSQRASTTRTTAVLSRWPGRSHLSTSVLCPGSAAALSSQGRDAEGAIMAGGPGAPQAGTTERAGISCRTRIARVAVRRAGRLYLCQRCPDEPRPSPGRTRAARPTPPGRPRPRRSRLRLPCRPAIATPATGPAGPAGATAGRRAPEQPGWPGWPAMTRSPGHHRGRAPGVVVRAQLALVPHPGPEPSGVRPRTARAAAVRVVPRSGPGRIRAGSRSGRGARLMRGP
jgi:hypothetical protein